MNHLGDLYQVAYAACRTILPGGGLPRLLVDRSGRFEGQGLLGARQQLLDRGVFRHQAAHQFNAILLRELVRGAQQRRQGREDGENGCPGTHVTSPAGGSSRADGCRRMGAFHRYANSRNSTAEVRILASGP